MFFAIKCKHTQQKDVLIIRPTNRLKNLYNAIQSLQDRLSLETAGRCLLVIAFLSSIEVKDEENEKIL